MAANTAYADFPRLAALHAGDGFLPKRWHNLLHMQTALLLRFGLLGLRNIIITEVPYHIGEDR
jgi:hypothetical protein